MELAFRRKLPTSQDHEKLKSMREEISRMLSGLINNLENQEAQIYLNGQ